MQFTINDLPSGWGAKRAYEVAMRHGMFVLAARIARDFKMRPRLLTQALLKASERMAPINESELVAALFAPFTNTNQ